MGNCLIMSIRIDGTNTAANPGITGADADTGLQFGTDEISFVTGGTNRATVESNGNFTIEDGNLVVAAGHGIDFSADANVAGMTSELLDDYEEGTWTPTPSSGTLLAGDGNYVKIGGQVFLSGYARFSDITTGSSIKMSLPFDASYRGSGAVFGRYVDSGKIPNAVYVEPGTNDLYLYVSGSTGNYAPLRYDELSTTANTFFFSISYQTNS